jgi:hypothetical protein
LHKFKTNQSALRPPPQNYQWKIDITNGDFLP